MVVKWGGDGYFAPNRFDADVADCMIEGEIPSDLDGAFFRLSADFLYAPAGFNALAADGYISRFRVKDGHVSYRGRYVQNERYRSQIAAQRQLFGAYRNPFTDDESVRNFDSPRGSTASNTTPVVLAGKLLATKEDALPFEIDPITLETRDYYDFDGQVDTMTFTAHPKVDPATGETFAFSYEAAGLCSRDVVLFCFDRTGKKTWECKIEAPYTCLMHDMWLTNGHIVIPGGGTMTSMERLKAGYPHWAWDNDSQNYYLVIPRHGRPEDLRVIEGPLRAIVHTINGQSNGNVLTLDAPAAEGNSWFPLFPALDESTPDTVAHKIRRFTIDLDNPASQIEEQILFHQTITNFTRIDDRFACQNSKYTWVQCEDPSRESSGMTRGRAPGEYAVTDHIARFNLETGECVAYYAGAGQVVQEPSFIPRPGSHSEGDGYLIAASHNVPQMRGELLIVDAMTMQECGRAILPFRLAPQIHGVWASAHDLRLD